MQVSFRLGVAAKFVEGGCALIYGHIVLRVDLYLLVEVGEGLLILMLHHVDVGTQLQSLKTGVGIVVREIFEGIVDVVESFDVIALLIIYVSAAEKSLGIVRII